MEPEVKISRSKGKKRGPVLIILLILIAVMLLSASVFAYLTLQNDNVYKGVYVGGIDASGMDMQQLMQQLESKYNIPSEKQEITLKAEDTELKATYPELGVKYDTQAAAEMAYSTGRAGNIFERLYDIASAGFSGISISVNQVYDQEKLDNFIDRFAVNVFQSVKEGSLLISEDKVVIKSGRHGEHIDKTAAAALVKDLITSRENGVIEPEIIKTNPAKFDAGEIYEQIKSEPVNAEYRVENGGLVLVPHSIGRDIDKTELTAIVSDIEQTEETERLLPVSIVTPEITSEIASSMLFRDELAKSSTAFATGTQNGKNRKHNMELAAAKIDGLILLPGQEFSYNDVVGPRNVENGYKTAHVYIQGRIEDGIGGGICQVSTTMYNSVLTADLKVTERRNHSFTVGYVPLGQDATAYYGGTDFRFVNSTRWPMKLKISVTGNKVLFSIAGTSETPGKSVVISNKVLKETPFEIKKIDDPTLPVGTTKELQEGLNGYVVETYKTITVNGKVISQAKLHTSRYNPCTQILLVGTKPAGGPKPAENAGSAEETKPEAGSDPEAEVNTDSSAGPESGISSTDSAAQPGETAEEPDDGAGTSDSNEQPPASGGESDDGGADN